MNDKEDDVFPIKELEDLFNDIFEQIDGARDNTGTGFWKRRFEWRERSKAILDAMRPEEPQEDYPECGPIPLLVKCHELLVHLENEYLEEENSGLADEVGYCIGEVDGWLERNRDKWEKSQEEVKEETKKKETCKMCNGEGLVDKFVNDLRYSKFSIPNNIFDDTSEEP